MAITQIKNSNIANKESKYDAAFAKLAALGLTEDEAKAIAG